MKIVSAHEPGAIYIGTRPEAGAVTSLGRLLAAPETIRGCRIALIDALVDASPETLEIARLGMGSTLHVDEPIRRGPWTGVGDIGRPHDLCRADILAAVVERLGDVLRVKTTARKRGGTGAWEDDKGASLARWREYVKGLGPAPFGYLGAAAFGVVECRAMAEEREAARRLRAAVAGEFEAATPGPEPVQPDPTPQDGIDLDELVSLVTLKPGRERPLLLLIDGNNYVHRFFHGYPMSKDRIGPNNALRGWESVIRRLKKEHTPDYALAIFDGDGEGWRGQLYGEYKGNRRPPDPDLLVQWPRIYDECDRFKLRWVRRDGEEADDFIASYCHQGTRAGLDVIIATNDKDLLQLVVDGPPSVKRLDSTDQLQGEAFVESKYGVKPWQLGDILALAGDTSDNIPGAPGVGPKHAMNLIREHGDLATAIKRCGLLNSIVATSVVESKDDLLLYRQLVGLKTDMELPVMIRDATW